MHRRIKTTEKNRQRICKHTKMQRNVLLGTRYDNEEYDMLQMLFDEISMDGCGRNTLKIGPVKIDRRIRHNGCHNCKRRHLYREGGMSSILGPVKTEDY